MHAKNEKVDSLVAQLAAIDQEREAIRAKGRKVKAELEKALAEENAAEWGLTVVEYDQLKAKASEQTIAEGNLHSAQIQIAKLTAKSTNPKYSEADRKKFLQSAEVMTNDLTTLKAAIVDACKEPLRNLLNAARRAKGLAAKNVQHATTAKLGK